MMMLEEWKREKERERGILREEGKGKSTPGFLHDRRLLKVREISNCEI